MSYTNHTQFKLIFIIIVMVMQATVVLWDWMKTIDVQRMLLVS